MDLSQVKLGPPWKSTFVSLSHPMKGATPIVVALGATLTAIRFAQSLKAYFPIDSMLPSKATEERYSAFSKAFSGTSLKPYVVTVFTGIVTGFPSFCLLSMVFFSSASESLNKPAFTASIPAGRLMFNVASIICCS